MAPQAKINYGEANRKYDPADREEKVRFFL